LSESISIYEQSWSVTGAISWMWRKLVEYSAGSADDDPLPAGRFVLKRNVEVPPTEWQEAYGRKQRINY
jgi:hypothetical protein